MKILQKAFSLFLSLFFLVSTVPAEAARDHKRKSHNFDIDTARSQDRFKEDERRVGAVVEGKEEMNKVIAEVTKANEVQEMTEVKAEPQEEIPQEPDEMAIPQEDLEMDNFDLDIQPGDEAEPEEEKEMPDFPVEWMDELDKEIEELEGFDEEAVEIKVEAPVKAEAESPLDRFPGVRVAANLNEEEIVKLVADPEIPKAPKAVDENPVPIRKMWQEMKEKQKIDAIAQKFIDEGQKIFDQIIFEVEVAKTYDKQIEEELLKTEVQRAKIETARDKIKQQMDVIKNDLANPAISEIRTLQDNRALEMKQLLVDYYDHQIADIGDHQNNIRQFQRDAVDRAKEAAEAKNTAKAQLDRMREQQKLLMAVDNPKAAAELLGLFKVLTKRLKSAAEDVELARFQAWKSYLQSKPKGDVGPAIGLNTLDKKKAALDKLLSDVQSFSDMLTKQKAQVPVITQKIILQGAQVNALLQQALAQNKMGKIYTAWNQNGTYPFSSPQAYGNVGMALNAYSGTILQNQLQFYTTIAVDIFDGQTDAQGNKLDANGEPIPGVYPGEVYITGTWYPKKLDKTKEEQLKVAYIMAAAKSVEHDYKLLKMQAQALYWDNPSVLLRQEYVFEDIRKSIS